MEVGTSDEEKVWRGKADEEVLTASRRLAEYTEEGQRVIRAEMRRRGLDESPPTIRDSEQSIEPQTGISHLERADLVGPQADGQSIEPQSGISHRYTDAYRVASALIAIGTTVKVTGAVVAVIIVLASIYLHDSLGSRELIGGLLIAGVIGLFFWIAGVLVTALGQFLRASVDTAVNTSPFLSDAEKTKMMGIAPL